MAGDLDIIIDQLRALKQRGVEVVNEYVSKQFLAACGIQVPSGFLVQSMEQARQAATELGPPFGLKLAANNAPHKSEVGGVIGPIGDLDELVGSFPDILRVAVEHAADGILVERWCGEGIECFVGLSFETPFGPILSFGLGGIWVELLRDVQHRLAPVNARVALGMMSQMRGSAVLKGGRGSLAVDLEGLVECLVRIGEVVNMSALSGLIKEVEINPLQARRDGPPVALDCKIALVTR